MLIEALPYIPDVQGQTGRHQVRWHAMTDASLKARFAQNVVLLKYVGLNPVGGAWWPKPIRCWIGWGWKAKFKHGVRVTDAATMEIVEMVLAGGSTWKSSICSTGTAVTRRSAERQRRRVDADQAVDGQGLGGKYRKRYDVEDRDAFRVCRRREVD